LPTNLPDYRSLAVDKPAIKLKASGPSADVVTISNTSPFSATLILPGSRFVGLDVKLDKLSLKPGEKAVLSIDCKGDKQSPKTPLTIAVTVQQTRQVIPINITFAN
jgi:hypothetical protein